MQTIVLHVCLCFVVSLPCARVFAKRVADVQLDAAGQRMAVVFAVRVGIQ